MTVYLGVAKKVTGLLVGNRSYLKYELKSTLKLYSNLNLNVLSGHPVG